MGSRRDQRVKSTPLCSRQSAYQPQLHGLNLSRLRLPGLLIIRLLFLLFCAWSLLGAPAKESTQAQEHADKGRQSAQIGDLKHAEAELRLALEKDPHNAVY